MTATATLEVTTAVEAVAAQKAMIIDRAVRASRERQWCQEFEAAMTRLFPEGSGQPHGDWYDSDGFTCRGLDLNGFDRDGFDRNGFDRDGFNHAGFDRDGYNREGFDQRGRNRDGLDRNGYDREGFRDGVNRAGIRKDSDEYRAMFRFAQDGYDVDGYNRDGHDRHGRTREQRAATCVYDADGYNAAGHDRYGYTREQNRY